MKTSIVSRMFQIVTTLQSGQGYTIDDLVNMLGTSRRTVYRDLESLEKAGVPCYRDKKTRHYSISSEFFLPPHSRIS